MSITFVALSTLLFAAPAYANSIGHLVLTTVVVNGSAQSSDFTTHILFTGDGTETLQDGDASGVNLTISAAPYVLSETAQNGVSISDYTIAYSGACDSTGGIMVLPFSTVSCTITLTHIQQPQTITVTTPAPASAAYGSSFDVAATGGGSSSPVAIAASGSCSGSGNDSATITMTSGTGACTVAFDQSGDANFSAASEVAETVTAQKADATVTVTPYVVTFDGNSHTALGTATGVATEDLSSGLDLSATAHTAVGSYPTDAWTFTDASGNYNDQNGTIDDEISAVPVVTHTLTYTAGANGSISGSATQVVTDGSDAAQVTAVPDAGFQFDSWSDGVTTADRTDTDVTADVTVTASFSVLPPAPVTHTLTYAAGSNGSISGNASQTVADGTDGTQVTATADSGYEFDSWSDGVTTASRTDTNVTADISATASFTAVPAAPVSSGGGGGGGNGPILALPNNGGAPAATSTEAAATSTGEVLGANSYHFNVDFGIGTQNEDVTQLQLILIGEGYLAIPTPTGYFGTQTKAAVKAYQTAHGITPVTGYVGPKTRAALNASDESSMSGDTTTVTLATLVAQLEAIEAQIVLLQN